MGDTAPAGRRGPTYGSSSTMGVGAAVLYARRKTSGRSSRASRDCRRMRRRWWTAASVAAAARRGAGRGGACARPGLPSWSAKARSPCPTTRLRWRRQGHAVRDAHLRRHLRGGGRRSRARAPAPPAGRRQLQRRADHQPEDRAGADDRRHHLGLGHGGDGGEPPRADARALAVEEPGRRRHPGERGHPGRHPDPLRRRVRRAREPARAPRASASWAATGVAAAVANAVFHATGKRVRELPITPDKLVGVAA